MRPELSADIAQLLAERRVESERLEYKAALNPVDEQRFTATVCAFANDLHNRNGGVIIGVAEHGGQPVSPAAGVQDPDRLQRRIVELCHGIQPTYLPSVEVVDVDGSAVIAVRCPPGDARPYLAKDANGRLVPWVRVASTLKVATGPILRSLEEVSARTPFDERVRSDLTIESLSLPMLRTHLVETRSRRAAEPETTPLLFQALNLARPVNGHVSPRNVALMFFTPRPAEWFPGGQIEVSVHKPGPQGTVIELLPPLDGPLPDQLRGALRALQPHLTSRVTKRADRPESEEVWAWPREAVEEVISNAVFHRGYDDPSATRVQVFPDKLRITSYPGPVPGLRREDLDADDRPAVPYRNRRIRDLLRDLSLVEAGGTGVADIRRAMARNGSPPPIFEFDDARTWFSVTLPKHRSFIERQGQPLRVGTPCPPDELVGREALLAHLWRMVEDESVVVRGHGRGATSVYGAMVAAPPPGWEVCRFDAADQSVEELEQWVRTQPAAEGRRLWIIDHLHRLAEVDGAWGWGFHEHVDDLVSALAKRDRVLLDRVRAPLTGPSFDTLDLPPLDAAATEDLAHRLLAGAGLDAPPDVVAAMLAASAGLPTVLIRLILRLKRLSRGLTPDDVSDALDEALLQPRDPTGLLARSRRYWRRSAVLERIPEGGVPPAELSASLLAAGMTRLTLKQEIAELRAEGVLVEVDGVLRFEHPAVRRAWAAAMANPDADDIPF
jgi:ATP-dependent DNA helicase RecG